MIRSLLIANRGEIAVRIVRTARELGVRTVVVFAEDDEACAHVGLGDVAHRLRGRGVAAYLDTAQILAAAATHGCDAIHPGYGFLSENADFARLCAQQGMSFVGPGPELIALFGDKARARALAMACGVPVLAGTAGAVDLDEAKAFLDALGPGSAVMIKAIAGGGGRGMRAVDDPAELAQAYARCRSEAKRSFGNDAVYVERFIRRARHVEVQIVGDGVDVAHLWDRECSLQRQNQKVVEIAPAWALSDALRQRLFDAARRMAVESRYTNLGTFEFLIDLDRVGEADEFCFIECNPRIQVEHTVTEEVLGIDLVRVQLEIASGRSLAAVGLRQADVPAPRGYAIQLRINMESMARDGRSRPGCGTLTTFAPPGGPGVRVDTFGYVGYTSVTSFDSLLAKLVTSTSSGDFTDALARARRAASEFAIEGVATNLGFLRALLAHPDVAAGRISTRFIEEHSDALLAAIMEPAVAPTDPPKESFAPDLRTVVAPMTGIIGGVSVKVGDVVSPAVPLAVIEAMKMEHVVAAEVVGIVRNIHVAAGDHIAAGATLFSIEDDVRAEAADSTAVEIDLDEIRDDLGQVLAATAATLDAARPHAVTKRRSRNQQTARENIAQLCDPDSFAEYGQLVVANQHSRGPTRQLRESSPADGLVMGLATVNAAQFGKEQASVAVASYDFTVFAGTQGTRNHRKIDRLFDVASELRLPLVLFAEGGGGRPGDDPGGMIAGLNTPTFTRLARLLGRVPVIGIASGRCFAGNAALLGCADVIIATENSNIGMGGPALIEAAGLGSFTPEQVGPIDIQSRNGVVDIRVADEGTAITTAKAYLSYFQGSVSEWTAADPRHLRHAVPENRLRAYEVRDVARLIADEGSFLELRAEYGMAYVTALIRVEGRPLGLIANNPMHNAAAIDADGADKAARFMRLCDAHRLPILSLIDTPGIMVGPDAEKTALVRHAARLFAASAVIEVPIFALVLRKAYGLGAMAAAGGNFHMPFLTAAWPTAEFGGMGLEGAVRLAHKKQLEAIADPADRNAYFRSEVDALYERGKALNAAAYFEVDAVIDPADTRNWIARGLAAAGNKAAHRERGFVDTW